MSALAPIKLELSKEILQILGRTGIGKIINYSVAEDHSWELLVVDIEVIELPQYPIFPVKPIERIEIKVVKNHIPIVFCRNDFPIVPHLNLHENGAKSLCLFDVSFDEIKYMFNASMFIHRILYWFTKTARAELHQPDQPIEPFFPSVYDIAILNANKDPTTTPFIRFEERRTTAGRLLTEIPLQEIERGRLFACLDIFINKTYTDNIIKSLPKTLFELDSAFDEDILLEIDKSILPIWTIKQNAKYYKLLFNQEETKLRNCPIILLIRISLARHPDMEPERYEIKVFTIDAEYHTLYRAFGYEKEGSKLVKKRDSINSQDIFITQNDVSFHLNRNFAQYISNTRNPQRDRNFVQIGLGTLGSQIANNCIRSGYGKWTYIDMDMIYPHNLSRHCLSVMDIGRSKVKSMATYSKTIFPDEADLCVKTPMESNILSLDFKDKYIEKIKDSVLVVDTSASIAVERYVCHNLAGTTRCVSFFMNPTGTHAIMLLEDEERTVTLDVLEIQYYNILVNDLKYHDHLKSENRVVYSSSCRGTSLRYPQDNAAAFSGLCSKAIKNATDHKDGLIAIWEMDEFAINSEIYAVEKFSCITCDSWKVKIKDSVVERFYKNRKAKLPCETGGVLIGTHDFEQKICYIVDFISSPEDSIESPCSYIRGSKGLLEKIKAIEEITAGNLGYIGEWHSHPDDCTIQSQDDKILMRSIAEYNATQSYPGCMVIVGETHFSIYLENI